jgi:hypothetical protein
MNLRHNHLMSTDGIAKNVEMLFAPAELAPTNHLGGVDEVLSADDVAKKKKEERNRGIVKEAWFFAWNNIAMTLEIMRDSSHYETGEYMGMGQGAPIQTEGVAGFVDQHIGDVWETLAITQLSRIPIEILARTYELFSKKKVDPRIKMGAAILIGMAVPASMEMGWLDAGNSVPDPLDTFGCLVGGIYASVGAKVINELLMPREVPLLDIWTEKMSKTAEKAQIMGANLATHAENWATRAGEVGGKIGSSIQQGLLDHLNSISSMGDYLEMEQRVALLMLEDWQKRQLERFAGVSNGKIDEEG